MAKDCRGIRQKGFTLIELMAVLGLLAIIAIIAVPSINMILKNAGESADGSSADMVAKAATIAHIEDNRKDTPGTRYEIDDLINRGFLDYDNSGDNRLEGYAIHTGSGIYEYGNKNLLKNSKYYHKYETLNSMPISSEGLPVGTYTISFDYNVIKESEKILGFLLYANPSIGRAPIYEDGRRTAMTFDITPNIANKPLYLYMGSIAATSRPNDGEFLNVKIERGTVATPWTPGE